MESLTQGPNNIQGRRDPPPEAKRLSQKLYQPLNCVEVCRHRNTIWLQHFDVVSCLSLDKEAGLLYSGLWNKTIKVW